jgi:hypothetical protein
MLVRENHNLEESKEKITHIKNYNAIIPNSNSHKKIVSHGSIGLTNGSSGPIANNGNQNHQISNFIKP